LIQKTTLKEQLIEEAYWAGAHAFLPYLQHADGRADSLDTNAVRANGLEALTLQTRSVTAMVGLRPEKALRLFEQIPVPEIPISNCSKLLTPDFVSYYQTAILVFNALPQRRHKTEEDTAFFRQVLEYVRYPAQVPPAIEAIYAVKLAPNQRLELLSILAGQLQGISSSDREYGAAESALVSALDVAHMGESDAGVLLTALRSYIVRHISAKRCSENVPPTGSMDKSADEYNRLALRWGDPDGSRYKLISADEAKPKDDGGTYPKHLIGHSPQSQAIYDALRWLTHGNRVRDGNVVPWTLKERSTNEWSTHFHDTEKLIHQLNEDDEESPEAFFCMKADALNILANLAPSGQMRDEAMEEFRRFLENYYSSIENPNLWFTMFRHMLYTARFSRNQKDKNWILAQLETSTNPIISFYAKIELRLGPPTESFPAAHIEASKG
jgi:hypothetical protein